MLILTSLLIRIGVEMEQFMQPVMRHTFEFAPQIGVLKFQHGAYGGAVWPCITQPTFLLCCAFPLSLERTLCPILQAPIEVFAFITLNTFS